jgi:hypothetical protein
MRKSTYFKKIGKAENQESEKEKKKKELLKK